MLTSLTNQMYKVNYSIVATGKYLIPGLTEMHYHFRSNDIESDMKLLLANGVTSVRNMAEFSGQDHVAIREKTRSGELLPLNYFTTGPYLSSTVSHPLKKQLKLFISTNRKDMTF